MKTPSRPAPHGGGGGGALRRLKFWQRIYFATLALFLACLMGGVLGVTAVSRRLSFDARCGEFLSRQHMLVQSMAEDIGAVAASRPTALPDLLAYYGDRYRAEGIGITVWKGAERLYSSQSAPQEPDELQALTPGMRVWQVRLAGGRHVICAATMLSDRLEGYIISADSDIESFYEEWSRLGGLFALLLAGVSAVFAVGLFAVLKRMNRPLQNLTDTARALAEGALAARADTDRRDDLGDLARTMNQMADRVESQLGELAAEAEGKQQLVDNLSHEMRTPLTAIGGYAEYIQRADLNKSELLEATDTIRFESRRLLNLSNQLIKLSVLGHEPPEFEPLDPNGLLKRVVYAVTPKAAGRGVQVKAHLIAPSTGQPPLWGDNDLVESLLVNLADNGVKACGKGGLVELRVRPGADGGCVFTVRDTGHGMDAETLGRIGRPFYRADKARSRAEGGAGLGVALCAAIVKAHGAELHYKSEPGRGTVATVRFPPEPPAAGPESGPETGPETGK